MCKNNSLSNIDAVDFRDIQEPIVPDDTEWSNIPIRDKFGSITIKSICGNDDREPVSNTNIAPWRTICKLLITYTNGTKVVGTGWMSGPRTVITAGHNVYSHSDGNVWAKRIVVIPGKDSGNNPFGYQNSFVFRSVEAWVTDEEASSDYGAIILPDTTLSTKTSWLQFQALKSSNLKNLRVKNGGYPTDKSYGSLWFDRGVINKVTASQIIYGIDTYEGSSGSPIFYQNDKGIFVVGIHNYGVCFNKATRINTDVFKTLTEWNNI